MIHEASCKRNNKVECTRMCWLWLLVLFIQFVRFCYVFFYVFQSFLNCGVLGQAGHSMLQLTDRNILVNFLRVVIYLALLANI